jgi:hypothetical protein
VPFEGVVYPRRGAEGGFAVAEDGTRYTALYGDAVENGAPITMNAFRHGPGAPG